jgi:hypothetical protein
MSKKLKDLVILIRGAGEMARTISGGVLQAILEHFNG